MEVGHVGQEIILLGDANRDYQVDVRDASAISRHIEGIETIPDKYLIGADINAATVEFTLGDVYKEPELAFIVRLWHVDFSGCLKYLMVWKITS